MTNENRDEYRQIFAAVFGDFYLFENLLGLEHPTIDHCAQQYLEQFHLHHKVRVRNGALSTTAASQGQRKRLALLTAYLEDRPFYVFDEWAADQDPHFKHVFYHELLPELKRRGKTVLVITHDDHYFHVADRTIKLDYGKIVTETIEEWEGHFKRHPSTLKLKLKLILLKRPKHAKSTRRRWCDADASVLQLSKVL